MSAIKEAVEMALLCAEHDADVMEIRVLLPTGDIHSFVVFSERYAQQAQLESLKKMKPEEMFSA